MKDILCLAKVTKFIFDDFTSDYKSRLISLRLLLLLEL